YEAFTGFNQSDPNPLDPNRDVFQVYRWVRTDNPVNFTQQQIKQLHEARVQDDLQLTELIESVLKNPPEETPNITSTMWKTSNAILNTTSFVFQVPDSIHFIVNALSTKSSFMALAFK
ncbi:32445_t:CDS:1, partial [Racocetra persica]